MSENKKEETFEEIKSRLREELNDLYERYGLDLVKLVVDEDELYRLQDNIAKDKIKTTTPKNQHKIDHIKYIEVKL